MCSNLILAILLCYISFLIQSTFSFFGYNFDCLTISQLYQSVYDICLFLKIETFLKCCFFIFSLAIYFLNIFCYLDFLSNFYFIKESSSGNKPSKITLTGFFLFLGSIAFVLGIQAINASNAGNGTSSDILDIATRKIEFPVFEGEKKLPEEIKPPVSEIPSPNNVQDISDNYTKQEVLSVIETLTRILEAREDMKIMKNSDLNTKYEILFQLMEKAGVDTRPFETGDETKEQIAEALQKLKALAGLH